MNINFNILWFEDTPDWYDEAKEKVEQLLLNHVLKAKITQLDGIEDFDVSIMETNNYDLILMDYALAGGSKGDEIIKLIRKNAILTDILFYSSDTNGMYNSFKQGVPDLDGVYFAKRNLSNGFLDKIQKLIDKIVKRSEDIVNLRGFVLDNTSAFEAKTEEVIYQCYQKLQENEKKIIDESLKKKLEHEKKENAKLIDSIAGEDKPIEAAKNSPKYHMPMWEKLVILKELVELLYKNYGLDETMCPKAINEYYNNQLGSYRNKLGHNVVEGTIITVGGEKIEVNQKLHRKLRENIVELNSIYEKLEGFISSL